MATLKGRIDRLLIELQSPKYGWRVVKRGPHYLAYPTNGSKAIPIPGSPSPSSVNNLQKRLQDGGYDREKKWYA